LLDLESHASMVTMSPVFTVVLVHPAFDRALRLPSSKTQFCTLTRTVEPGVCPNAGSIAASPIAARDIPIRIFAPLDLCADYVTNRRFG
jgi:hypothetical protein